MNRKPSILKVNLDNDIRRVSLSANNFVELQKQIAELFSVQPGSFSLKYKDEEGDMISICSEEEYREALVCCQTDILRIFAFLNKPTQENKHPKCRRGQWKKWCKRNPEHHHQHQQAPPTENTNQQPDFHNLFQFLGPFQNIASNLLQGGNFDQILGGLLNSDQIKLEHNHVCDGCDTQISGSRYHCTQCPDFDFCSTCYQEKVSTHFSDHKFEEISAVQAFKQAMFNNENIEAFFMPGKSTDPVEKITHRAFCDRCNQTIVGLRWKCFDCEDFDFCNSCYVAANGIETINTHLKTHAFGKIESPQDESFPTQKKEYFLNKQQEQERLEKERLEKERIEKERLEKERLEKERQEQERLEKERLEKERLEKERLEKEKSNSNRIVYPFEKKLEDLASMGFEDRTTNIRLLIKNKGDVVATIQELIGN